MRFCEISGANIDFDKTRGFWLGAWALTPSVFANIRWNGAPVRYLDVPLDNHRNSGPHWTSAITTIRRKVLTWQGRDLSVISRAKACNIFLASKLVYILQVLHCSRVHIQAFHRIFACFIWSSWEAMRRDNLFLPLEKGGSVVCICLYDNW